MNAFEKLLLKNFRLNLLYVFFQWLSGVFNFVIFGLLVKHYKADDRGPQMVLAYMLIINVSSFSFMCSYIYFLPNRMSESKFFGEILFDGGVHIADTVVKQFMKSTDGLTKWMNHKDKQITQKFNK